MTLWLSEQFAIEALVRQHAHCLGESDSRSSDINHSIPANDPPRMVGLGVVRSTWASPWMATRRLRTELDAPSRMDASGAAEGYWGWIRDSCLWRHHALLKAGSKNADVEGYTALFGPTFGLAWHSSEWLKSRGPGAQISSEKSFERYSLA